MAEGLGKRSLPIVAPYLHREKDQAIRRYMDRPGGTLTSDSIEEIVPSAAAGRIDTLFVDTGVPKWGKYDPASGRVELHSVQEGGDEDLLDAAFTHTYLNGGNVYGLDSAQIAAQSGAAAIFRY